MHVVQARLLKEKTVVQRGNFNGAVE